MMDECWHIFHTHIARNIGKAKTASLPANVYSSKQTDLWTEIETENLLRNIVGWVTWISLGVLFIDGGIGP